MTLSKLRHKLFAGTLGMLVGVCFLVSAPLAIGVDVIGTGGTITTANVIQTATTTGATTSTINVPVVGTCSACVTYAMNGYVYHAFTSGTPTFTTPAGLTSVDVLLVGGGGGGGGNVRGGGGGGGGGVRWVTGQAVSQSTLYNITVGAGGAGGTATNNAAGNGSSGGTSSFDSLLSVQGGGGGLRGNLAGATAAPTTPANGGGGGGGGSSSNGVANTGATAGTYGRNGANGNTSTATADQSGGGGGGGGSNVAPLTDMTAGTVGSNTSGGAGGSGVNASTLVGTQFGQNGWFGGGGGGGKRSATAGEFGGVGGRGGGGYGGNGGAATAGLANTGGGGGGGGSGAGSAGGSGIVIVRYLPPTSGPQRVVHVFNTVGTWSFTPPAGLTSIDVLVVGGGGGGGSNNSDAATVPGAGGGGGGQYRYVTNQAVTPLTPYNVVVGAGGSGAVASLAAARSGGTSSFDGATIQSLGGGYGGFNTAIAGSTGGSGGGGRAAAGGAANGTGTTAGGSGGNPGGGGGGGGAGLAGVNGTTTALTPYGGDSGYGTMNTITGTPVSYGGGGGGGAYYSATSLGTIYGGSAGAGGGGLGGSSTSTTGRSAGSAGTANTGGGGGGASGSSAANATDFAGGNGGSGIVVISYVPPTVPYTVHTFTSSGTFVAPPGVSSVEVLVVGGGGGGGGVQGGVSAGGGGGGAGGLIYNAAFAITPLTSIPVTVGAGGAGGAIGPNSGQPGTDSVFSTLTAVGGGGGVGILTATSTGTGGSGGSGGGSRGANGGASTQGGGGFGFRGGNYTPLNGGDGASGGGGAGGTGGDDATDSGPDPGTAGGVGLAYSISGTSTFYAGGGGGGSPVGTAASGGNGGGGAGSTSSAAAVPGTDGLGGGGGGGTGSGAGTPGADGGDGVVIVRYRPPTMTITTQHTTGDDFDVGATLSNIVVSLRTATGAAVTTATNVIASVASPGTVTAGGTTSVAMNTGTGDATFSDLQLSATALGPLATTLRFSVANTTGTVDSNSLDLQTFYVEIDHGSNYGVCTPSTPITLRIERTGTNTTVTNFAGAINVTNSGNHGNYASQANLTNEGGNDGTATYTFTGTQNGTITLAYSTATQGNITFSASGTNIPLQNYSSVLDVGPCEFRIDTDLNGNVCNAETVTISITDEVGTIFADYTGQVTISTSTSVGSWAIGDGLGTFVAGGGNGGATYTFHDNDNGTVALQFFHPQTGTVDISVASVIGGYVDNESFDDNLTIGSCTLTPQPWQQVCSGTSNTVNIDVPAAGTDRLLLVTTHRTGSLALGTETMTYNGINMTLIREEQINSGAADVQAQVYGLLDSQLPAAGTYAVVAQNDANTAVCALVYQNIAQTALPPAGALVGGSIVDAAGNNITINTITTVDANTLVVSAATGRLAPNDSRNWDNPPDVADSDLTARLFSFATSPTTSAVTFGVSAGIITSPGLIDIEEEHDGGTTVRRAHVAAAFSPAAPVLTSFQITHSGNGSTCVSSNAVTIKAVDQYGNTLTSYVGTVTLDAGTTGDWYQGTATNSVANGLADDGDAAYTFAPGDAGQATLHFGRTTTGSVNFNVNDGSIVENVFFDASMNFGNCVFRVSHEGASGSTCQSNLITIGVYSAAGSLVTDYAGLVTLRSAVPVAGGNGGWTAYTATNSVTDTVANDGEATYQFSTLDGGDVVLAFSKTTASTVNFTITAANSMVIDAGYDPDLILLDCRFRIDHDDDGDSTAEVCMPESVKFTVVNTGGTVQTRYVGSPNITVSDANGTWSSSVPAIAARLTDSGLSNGQASFTFNTSDAGEVTLRLMHHNSTLSSISINISAGGAFIEEVAYDPAITSVTGCKIRFSLSPPNITTCGISTVTLGVYNSANTLATEYAGTVSLTTSTVHGHWLSDNGPGTLTDTAPTTDGAATYTFVAADGGDAELKFTNTIAETLNFNATANSGAITEDTTDGPDAGTEPDYDPNMVVTPCLPTVFETACYQNQNQVDAITLRSTTDTQGSRMVLVYIASNSSVDATGATIEGASQAMTFLRTETASNSGDTKLHVYAILDTHLPAAAGDYDVAFTGSANSPAMCIVALEGTAQTFPSATATLNGAVKNNDDTISTNLTTAQNNSIIVGVVANGQGGAEYTPAAFTGELWQDNAYDPAGGDWAGFYDYKLAAGVYSFVTDANLAPNRQAQIALAISPFVSGAAATTGYVPVSLFQTLSGNVNYRAIGNTLRTDPNGTFACLMQNEATGSTATLTLPANSKVRYAYLYWAGSGYANQLDQDVKFGIDGGSRPNTTTADGTFVIAPNQVYNQAYPAVPEGFFGAYKNVTGLFPTYPAIANTSYTMRFSDLTVQVGSPWFDFETCIGGWALVVMYENALEPFQVINLFHGFQPFYHSAFTLVPRNFRMAKPDGISLPHAQVSHITFEGDENIDDVGEVLQLQNDPFNTTSFDILSNSANPGAPASATNNQYNSTVSFPNYDINLVYNGTITSTNTSYGTDIDTFYVEGDDMGELLFPFGDEEAEQITTRYSTENDIVLLMGELISVTNSPIADLEITVTDSATPWKVNSTGGNSFIYTVKNNGDGALGGFANGDVIMTGELQAGLTINSISATGWSCSNTTDKFTCIFEIATEWTTVRGAATNGQLAKNESLPAVTVTVNIANDTTFQLLNNPVETIGRIAHVGEYYNAACQGQGAAIGVQPNPNPSGGCDKPPQFDNVNDLNKYLVDIDDLDDKTGTNNNVDGYIRDVIGVSTDLSMTKTLVGILEANAPATYRLTVTNTSAEATTKTITVTDTLPSGLVPSTASGTDWTCGISGQLVTCTRSNPLAAATAAPYIEIVTQNIVSPAVEGVFVFNTGTVAVGNYNIDPDPLDNSHTINNEVTGPVASATDRFLISVNQDTVDLGGLNDFNDGDLVMYDPVAGTATMFLAESSIPGTTNLGNIDALHVLPNGQIVMSTATDGSTIAGVTFNAEDLVLYDPVLKVATLIFDGSTIFLSDTSDIDALHVLYNNSFDPKDWDIIFSTTATAEINAVTFQDNDIVRYDMGAGAFGAGGSATVLEDGADADLFGGANGDISSLYIRYDNSNKYILSSSDATTTVGLSGTNQQYESGEQVEVDLTTPGDTLTDPLLCDNQTPCEGSPAATFTPGTAYLDAAHMIESGYFGHFSISVTPGTACTATTITIRKHKHVGLATHVVDTTYKGAVKISSSLAMGTWAKDVTAMGTLYTTGYGLGTGEAIYVFADGMTGDDGEVILTLTNIDATNSFNVNVTNLIGAENNPTEDPTSVINEQITSITYIDNFAVQAYNHNDGTAGFATAWDETNDDDVVSTGKIIIDSGTNQLRFNNNAGGADPSVTRTIDFSGYTVDAQPVLTFNYSISGSPSGSPNFVAEVSDNGSSWTTLWSTTATSGSGPSGNLNIPAPWTGTKYLRFRIDEGYSGNNTQFMYIDNVSIATQTFDCSAGDAVDHYSMQVQGSLTSATCLVPTIRITPHTLLDGVTEPGSGVTIQLSTSTGKGRWGRPAGALGTFTAASDNGQATYQYAFGEDTLDFPFYYTDVTGFEENVTFSLSDSNVPTKYNSVAETNTLTVRHTALRFFDETANSATFPTLVAGAPSGVYPAHVLTIQAVRSSNNDPSICEAAFPNNTDVAMKLVFECIDPSSCSASTAPVSLTNNGNTVTKEPIDVGPTSSTDGAWGVTTAPLRFTTNGSYSRAQIALTYLDAGSLRIYAQHQIQVKNENDSTIASGDYMEGTSSTFVVRPFAFDIDFSSNRGLNGNDSDASSWANSATEMPAFMAAGLPFSTTVRAVLWQCLDDDPAATGCGTASPTGAFDGMPASTADLSYNPTLMTGNVTTPNFGAGGSESAMTLTHSLVLPSGGAAGTLTGGAFTAFTNGESTHNLRYSEVGIIDLVAALDSNPGVGYLGSNEDVVGHVRNVGRFKPDHFVLSVPLLTPRPARSPSTDPFTYFGEEFGIGFTLTAYNGDTSPAITRNYVGDFARLRTTTTPFSFYAVDDITGAADTNYTFFPSSSTLCNGDNNNLRLCQAPGNNVVTTNDWTSSGNGVRTFSGRLILDRQLSEVEENPITDMMIGVRVLDSDSVADQIATPIDLDDSADDATDATYNLISQHVFRYGRIRLENAYGSNVPDYYDHDNNDATAEILQGRDVGVRYTAEYWNGTRFIVNTDDTATDYDSAQATLLDPDTMDALMTSDVAITAGTGKVSQGVTMEKGTTDVPIYLRAPLTNEDGQLVLELNLDALGLPFLKYDWRSAAANAASQNGDVDPDGTIDNPRALVDFGTFRGNDRIINWQEIFR